MFPSTPTCWACFQGQPVRTVFPKGGSGPAAVASRNLHRQPGRRSGPSSSRPRFSNKGPLHRIEDVPVTRSPFYAFVPTPLISFEERFGPPNVAQPPWWQRVRSRPLRHVPSGNIPLSRMAFSHQDLPRPAERIASSGPDEQVRPSAAGCTIKAEARSPPARTTAGWSYECLRGGLEISPRDDENIKSQPFSAGRTFRVRC